MFQRIATTKPNPFNHPRLISPLNHPRTHNLPRTEAYYPLQLNIKPSLYQTQRSPPSNWLLQSQIHILKVMAAKMPLAKNSYMMSPILIVKNLLIISLWISQAMIYYCHLVRVVSIMSSSSSSYPKLYQKGLLSCNSYLYKFKIIKKLSWILRISNLCRINLM